jgi:hypothetical protein
MPASNDVLKDLKTPWETVKAKLPQERVGIVVGQELNDSS